MPAMDACMSDTKILGPSDLVEAKQAEKALIKKARAEARANFNKGPSNISFDATMMMKYSASELRDILIGVKTP